MKWELCYEILESVHNLNLIYSSMHLSNVLSVILLGDQKKYMEVHLGKYHSENFECGLCEHKEKSLENLITHLFTCEIFLCDVKCKEKPYRT